MTVLHFAAIALTLVAETQQDYRWEADCTLAPRDSEGEPVSARYGWTRDDMASPILKIGENPYFPAGEFRFTRTWIPRSEAPVPANTWSYFSSISANFEDQTLDGYESTTYDGNELMLTSTVLFSRLRGRGEGLLELKCTMPLQRPSEGPTQ